MMTRSFIKRSAGVAAIAVMVIGAIALALTTGCGGDRKPQGAGVEGAQALTAEDIYALARDGGEPAQAETAEIVNACEEAGGEGDKLFMPCEHVGNEIKMKICANNGALFATYSVNGKKQTTKILYPLKENHQEFYAFFDIFAYDSNCPGFHMPHGLYVWYPSDDEPKYLGHALVLNDRGLDGPGVGYVGFTDDLEYALIYNIDSYGSAPSQFSDNIDIRRTRNWNEMLSVEAGGEGQTTLINARENTITFCLCPSPEAVTKFYGKYEIDESDYVEEPNPGESSDFGLPNFYEVCDMNYATGAIKKVRGVWRYSP